MTEFVTPNPLGYSVHDPITAAQMNLINEQLPKAPNFTDGNATYTPPAAVSVGGAGMRFFGGATVRVTGAGTKVQVESDADIVVDGAASAINLVNAAQFVAGTGTYVTINGLLQIDGGSANLTPGTTFTVGGTLDCVSGSNVTIRGGLGVVNGGVLTVSAGGKLDLVGTGMGSGPATMTLKDTCSIDFTGNSSCNFGAATKMAFTSGSLVAGSIQLGKTGLGNGCNVTIGEDSVFGGGNVILNGDVTQRGPITKTGTRAVVAERVTNIPDSASSATPVTVSVADADVFLIDNVNSSQARIYTLDKTSIIPPKGAKMRFSRPSSTLAKPVTLTNDAGTPATIVTMAASTGWVELVYSGTEWVPSAWGGTGVTI